MAVSPGQIYESQDPRDDRRRVRVEALTRGKRTDMVVATDLRTGHTVRFPALLLEGALWAQVEGP